MKLTTKERELLLELTRDYPDLQQKLRKPGRPRRNVDWARGKQLREQGWSFKKIAAELGVALGTVYAHLNGSG
jgi:hypothetical protein